MASEMERQREQEQDDREHEEYRRQRHRDTKMKIAHIYYCPHCQTLLSGKDGKYDCAQCDGLWEIREVCRDV